MIFGTFFFVSTERRILSRDAFTWVDLLSKAGGLISLVNLLFIVLGTIMNMEAILISIVEQTYYHSPDHKKVKRIRLGFFDHIFRPFSLCINKIKKPTCKQKNFKLAVESIEKDLDIVYII